MADGTLTIDADTTGLNRALDGSSQHLDKLNRTTNKTATNLNNYGTKLGKTLGKGGNLMGNIKNAGRTMNQVAMRTTGMTSAVKMLGKEGASVGQRVQGGINLAAQAVTAFAGPGGLIVGAITLVAGLALGITALYKEAQEETTKTTEEIENLAKAAVAANKTIFELEMAKKLTEETEAVVAAEEAWRVRAEGATQAAVTAAIVKYEKAVEQLRRAETFSSDSFLAGLAEREKRIEAGREKKKKRDKHYTKIEEDKDKAAKKSAKLGIDRAKKRAEADEKAMGVRLLTLRGERAVRIRQWRDTIKDLQAQHQFEVEQDAKAADLRISKRAAEDKERDDKQAAHRNLQLSMLADLKRVDTETAAWKAEQRKIEAEARKAEADAREQEMQDLIKQSRGFSDIASAGFSTVTGELFSMAQAGEFSAKKLLNATLSSIGQQMVAQGTKFAFEGTAKGLGGDPRGFGIAAIGVAEIAAGVAMGAAAGAGQRAVAAAEGAGASAASPVDTRETRAAATSSESGGGPVIINFQGDVYDKRGVAQVLNSGLSMAKHRRIRGA